MARTILLVEDEESVQKLFRRVLERVGYHVIVCSTLADGRRAVSSINFDLVLTDGRLPDGKGATWAEELYAAGKRVLLVSGTEQSLIVPMLVKPVVPLTKLTDKVREVLGRA